MLPSGLEAQNCCRHLYLFSSDILADSYSVVLGIYSYVGEIDERPYYSKSIAGLKTEYILTYLSNMTYGSPGWSIVDQLGKNGSLFLTTNSTDLCPVGIQGAGTYSGIDLTFAIECHNDELRNTCDDCQLMQVSSTLLMTLSPVSLGLYSRKGSFNGYPLFAMDKTFQDTNSFQDLNITFYLYFRKQGMVLTFF